MYKFKNYMKQKVTQISVLTEQVNGLGVGELRTPVRHRAENVPVLVILEGINVLNNVKALCHLPI